jgi:hypothetical protein
MQKNIYLLFVTAICFLLTSLAHSQTNTKGPFGIEGADEDLPSSAVLVAKGKVVSINQEDHTVLVSDLSGSFTNVYPIVNRQMLGNVNPGENIKIFVQNANSNSNVSFGIEGIDDELPINATFVIKGIVIGVDQEDHTVSVRDLSGGFTNVYSIIKKQMLDSVKKGDNIKIFTQPRV